MGRRVTELEALLIQRAEQVGALQANLAKADQELARVKENVELLHAAMPTVPAPARTDEEWEALEHAEMENDALASADAALTDAMDAAFGPVPPPKGS